VNLVRHDGSTGLILRVIDLRIGGYKEGISMIVAECMGIPASGSAGALTAAECL
jgi:hypothetical protein